jgi:hypothetical protein
MANRILIKCVSLLVVFGAINALAQVPSSSSKPAPVAGVPFGQEGSSGLGFSIESEMLTYRALESNSEAVACDLAAFLTGGSVEFGKPLKGAHCKIKGGTPKKASVVIVPFDGSTVDNFRLWRANMEIMADLRFRAEGYCPESNVRSSSSRGLSSSSPSSSSPPSKVNSN